jgi:hypothetical protein
MFMALNFRHMADFSGDFRHQNLRRVRGFHNGSRSDGRCDGRVGELLPRCGLVLTNGSWRFPEMGVPPVIIHFRLGFSVINQKFWGTPHLWKPPFRVFVVVIAWIPSVSGFPPDSFTWSDTLRGLPRNPMTIFSKKLQFLMFVFLENRGPQIHNP